jgi:hypothetical protein
MSQVKTSTKYRVHADKVLPFTHQEGSVVDRVPVGYYKVDFHPMMGFYLTRISETVKVPENLFGSAESRCDRIFQSYNSSPASLGVGLFGKKGAGKSLLASVIGARGIAQGLPVIDVSESFSTDSNYLEFLNSLEECVIIFDEFLKHLSKIKTSENDDGLDRHERKYKAQDRQDEMLTFFQGAQNTKRLIVLIDNSAFMLSEFLTDRPGRMRYIYTYDGVEKEVVQQLAKHHGLSEDKTQAVTVYALRFKVSFDVINEVIKEWTRYPDDSLEQITEILNVPTLKPDVNFKVRITSFDDSEKECTLASELGTMSSQGEVKVPVEVRNALYGRPKMTREEYENSDEYFDGDWSDYETYWDKPVYPAMRYFNDQCLVAIKGNQQAYSNGRFTATVQIMQSTVVNSSDNWLNAL